MCTHYTHTHARKTMMKVMSTISEDGEIKEKRKEKTTTQ